MSRERGSIPWSSMSQRKAELEHVQGQRISLIGRLDAELGAGPATVEAVVRDARVGLAKESTEASAARISDKIDQVDRLLLDSALDQLKGLAQRGVIPASVYEKRLGEMQAIYSGITATPLQSGESAEAAAETAALVPDAPVSSPIDSLEGPSVAETATPIEVPMALTPAPTVSETTIPPLAPKNIISLLSEAADEPIQALEQPTEAVSTEAPISASSPLVESGGALPTPERKAKSKSVTFSWDLGPETVDFPFYQGRNIGYDILHKLQNTPGMTTTDSDIKAVIRPGHPETVADVTPYLYRIWEKLDEDPQNPVLLMREGRGKDARYGLNPDANFAFPDEEVSPAIEPAELTSVITDEAHPEADTTEDQAEPSPVEPTAAAENEDAELVPQTLPDVATSTPADALAAPEAAPQPINELSETNTSRSSSERTPKLLQATAQVTVGDKTKPLHFYTKAGGTEKPGNLMVLEQIVAAGGKGMAPEIIAANVRPDDPESLGVAFIIGDLRKKLRSIYGYTDIIQTEKSARGTVYKIAQGASITLSYPESDGQTTDDAPSAAETTLTSQETATVQPDTAPRPEPEAVVPLLTHPTPVTENGKQVYRAALSNGRWTNDYSFGLRNDRNVSFDALLHMANNPGVNTTYEDIQRIVDPQNPKKVLRPESVITNLYIKLDDDPSNPSIVVREGRGRQTKFGLHPDVRISFPGQAADTRPAAPEAAIRDTAENKGIVRRTSPAPIVFEAAIPAGAAIEQGTTPERQLAERRVVSILGDKTRVGRFNTSAGRNIQYDIVGYLQQHPGLSSTKEDLQKVINPNDPTSVGDVEAYVAQARAILRDSLVNPELILREGTWKNARYGLNPEATFSFPDEAQDVPQELIENNGALPSLPTTLETTVPVTREVFGEPVPIPRGQEVDLPPRSKAEVTTAHTELVDLDESQKKNKPL